MITILDQTSDLSDNDYNYGGWDSTAMFDTSIDGPV